MIAYLVKLMRELTQNITKERASKLDRLSNLDRSLSGVENNIGRKIDNLASSSQGSNPNLALSNLTGKIDALKQNDDTKSSQSSVDTFSRQFSNTSTNLLNKVGVLETNILALTKKAQGSVKTVQRGSLWISNGEGDLSNGYAPSFGVDGTWYDLNITIPRSVSSVDKCLLIVNIIQGNGDPSKEISVLGSLNGQNKIMFAFMVAKGVNIKQKGCHLSWQLVEFY